MINGIYCYYNSEGAVFRVQGLLPNKEICPNIARKSPKKMGKIKNCFYCCYGIGVAVFRVQF